ncbi:hypothetical protein CBR_g32196 [Chara braunii]|uniref:PROP1-like PPR domain-containing protein n=1 Tax=Chara braunii TaxID=69332 RepID=A0A388JMX7_CHABU|nr:hypothetical protein CBR_g32196 [Chara braunii]|eukprot:GBG59180.1 hypothetical protein CBR_g32196 [Chara braunii]
MEAVGHMGARSASALARSLHSRNGETCGHHRRSGSCGCVQLLHSVAAACRAQPWSWQKSRQTLSGGLPDVKKLVHMQRTRSKMESERETKKKRGIGILGVIKGKEGAKRDDDLWIGLMSNEEVQTRLTKQSWRVSATESVVDRSNDNSEGPGSTTSRSQYRVSSNDFVQRDDGWLEKQQQQQQQEQEQKNKKSEQAHHGVLPSSDRLWSKRRRKEEKRQHSWLVETVIRVVKNARLLLLEETLGRVKLKRALRKYQNMLGPRELCIVLKSLDDCKEAAIFFQWMKSVPYYRPDLFAYTIMIAAYARDGKMADAERLKQEMERHGFLPDAITFGSLILGYGRQGMLADAERLYIEMRAKEFVPDTRTYTTLMNLYSKAGRCNDAMTVFWGMEAGIAVKRGATAVTTMKATITTAATATATATATTTCLHHSINERMEADALVVNAKAGGTVKDITDLHLHLRKDKWDDVGGHGEVGGTALPSPSVGRRTSVPSLLTYCIALEACRSGKMYAQGVRVFERLLLRGIKPDAAAFTTGMNLYMKTGQHRKGEKVYQLYKSWGRSPSTSMYSTMINLYGQIGEFGAAGMICEEMRRSGCELDEPAYCTMLQLYGRTNQVDAAMELFENMRKLGKAMNPKTWVTMMSICERTGRYEDVWRVFDESQKHCADVDGGSKICENPHAYSVLLRAYAKGGRVGEIVSMLKEDKGDGGLLSLAGGGPKGSFAGVRPDRVMLGGLLHALVQAGHCDEASTLAEEIRTSGLELDIPLYISLAKLYVKMGRHQDAIDLYEGMKTVGIRVCPAMADIMIHMHAQLHQFDKVESVFRDADVHDRSLWMTMANAYGGAGRWKDCEGLLERIRNETGTVPWTGILNRVMKVLMEAGEYERAKLIARLMKRQRIHEMDVESLALLVELHVRDGRPDRAVRAWERSKLDGREIRTHTYNLIIKALGDGERLQEAMRVFEEMEALGVKPDAVTCSTVLDVYGKAGLLESGAALVNRLRKEHKVDLDPPVFNTLIKWYLKGGNKRKAKEILKHMEDGKLPPPSQATYTTLICHFAKKGLCKEALNMHRRMVGRGMKGDDVGSWVSLIHCCNRSREPEIAQRAVKLFDGMVAAGHRPPKCVFTALVNIHGRAGNTEKAEEAFREMEKEGHVADDVAYLSLMNAYVIGKQCAKADALLTLMRQAGIQPDVRHYTAVMVAYGRCGLMGSAIEMWEKMARDGCSRDVAAYRAIMALCAQAGRVGKIQQLWREMEEAGVSVDNKLYRNVVQVLKRAGISKDVLDMEGGGVEVAVGLLELFMREAEEVTVARVGVLDLVLVAVVVLVLVVLGAAMQLSAMRVAGLALAAVLVELVVTPLVTRVAGLALVVVAVEVVLRLSLMRVVRLALVVVAVEVAVRLLAMRMVGLALVVIAVEVVRRLSVMGVVGLALVVVVEWVVKLSVTTMVGLALVGVVEPIVLWVGQLALEVGGVRVAGLTVVRMVELAFVQEGVELALVEVVVLDLAVVGVVELFFLVPAQLAFVEAVGLTVAAAAQGLALVVVAEPQNHSMLQASVAQGLTPVVVAE